MNITIIGRKCNPHEDFRARAEKRLSKIEKLVGPDATAKITATAEKSSNVVEVTVTKSGMIFRAEERSEDMINAWTSVWTLSFVKSAKTKRGSKRRSIPLCLTTLSANPLKKKKITT